MAMVEDAEEVEVRNEIITQCLRWNKLYIIRVYWLLIERSLAVRGEMPQVS
jgi:hypothetical protein